MTIDKLIKILLDDEVLKTIDVTDSLEEYLSSRMNEVKDSETYIGLEKERNQLEEGFLALYTDKQKGIRDITRYNDLSSSMQVDSERTYFNHGFYEGLKLLLHLMEILYHPKSTEANQKEESPGGPVA